MCVLNKKYLSDQSIWLEPISKEDALDTWLDGPNTVNNFSGKEPKYPQKGESCGLQFLVDQLTDHTLLDTQKPSLSLLEEEINNEILLGSHWLFISFFVIFGKWFLSSRFITHSVEVKKTSNEGVSQSKSATGVNSAHSAGISREITSTGRKNSEGDDEDSFFNRGLIVGFHYHDYVSFIKWFLGEGAASLSNSQVS